MKPIRDASSPAGVRTADVGEAVGALVRRAEGLRALTAQLANDAYVARWDFVEAARAGGMSDEVRNHLLGHLGFDGLEDTMVEVCREAGTAVDFGYPSEPPEWYTRAHAARQRRAAT